MPHETAHTGLVTAVRPQSRRPDRVSVFVDGSFSFGLPAVDAVAMGLRKDVQVDETLLARALEADLRSRAMRRALDLLAYRARSVGELRSRLERAAYEPAIVDQVMQRLDELGYMDDTAFAVEYARGRIGSKGYGARRVVAELRRRGVSASLAADAVRAAEEQTGRDPTDDAVRLGERALGRLRGVTDPVVRRRRLYGFLARRGFESEVIREALARLSTSNSGAGGSQDDTIG